MLNDIKIMGRLTRDPELRHTQAGKAVTSFTVACDRDYADKEGNRETDFIPVVAWNNAAENIVKHFKKGSLIIVSGRLQIRPWTKESGEKQQTTEIVLERFYFAEKSANGKKTDAAPASAPAASNGNASAPLPSDTDYAELEDDDGDLPF